MKTKQNKTKQKTKFCFVSIFYLLFIILLTWQCNKEKEKLKTNHQKDIPIITMNESYIDSNDSFYVEQDVAEIYAKWMNVADSSFHGDEEKEIESWYPVENENEIPCMWVFNYEDGGWVILSADYRCEPILAYNSDGSFTPDTIPDALGMWIDATIENIDALRTGDYDNGLNGLYSWKSTRLNYNISTHLAGKRNMPLDGEIDEPCVNPSIQIKGSLMQTTWGQECTYNDYAGTCSNNSICDHKYAGCVSVAVGQVLYYFNKTSCCTGFNYSLMPLNNGNGHLSGFLKELGDRVYMDYGCDKSGAAWNNYKNVFTTWYGYSNSNNGSYSLSTVISNISNNKPVVLSGCREQTPTNKKWWQFWKPKFEYNYCHAWAWDCDGFTKFEYCNYAFIDMLHMNWGWHEVDPITLQAKGTDFNGWYRYNNWTLPNGRNYQYANNMIYNLQL